VETFRAVMDDSATRSASDAALLQTMDEFCSGAVGPPRDAQQDQLAFAGSQPLTEGDGGTKFDPGCE
jgi:hypothetical protein